MVAWYDDERLVKGGAFVRLGPDTTVRFGDGDDIVPEQGENKYGKPVWKWRVAEKKGRLWVPDRLLEVSSVGLARQLSDLARAGELATAVVRIQKSGEGLATVYVIALTAGAD